MRLAYFWIVVLILGTKAVSSLSSSRSFGRSFLAFALDFGGNLSKGIRPSFRNVITRSTGISLLGKSNSDVKL